MKFIVFEGIDGCGKGTQLNKVASYLFKKSKEIDLYITREPTRDFKQIREKLAKDTDAKSTPEWYAEMFVKDRINHINNYIQPALNNNKLVLCDRYKYSTLAYQHTQGMDIKQLQEMHKGLLIPDLTFIFDCPAEIAFERRKADGATEVFDKDIKFQEELRQNYLKLKDDNIIIIDATKSIEQVYQEIIKHIDALFFFLFHKRC